MAHFLIQRRGQMWGIPSYRKLNLTVNADKERLEKLRADNENVYKISFAELKDKEHAIIEGKLVSVYIGSALKLEIMKLAVEKRWSHEETMRALYEIKPSERKQILKAAAEEL
jgi:hypothetical protein